MLFTGQKRERDVAENVELDDAGAVQRAIDWLVNDAPQAIESCGGDRTTYNVACVVRDIGVEEGTCLQLMAEHWNPEKAIPPWQIDELGVKVANAYSYAENPAGAKSALHDFGPVELETSETGNGVTSDTPKQPELPPLPALTLEWWAGRDLPEPEYMCGRWLTTTSRAILNAPTGLGKSMWTLGLGMAIAAQREFLHWQPGGRKFRVLYIDGEMSNRLLKQRLADEVRRLGVMPKTFWALSHEDFPGGLAPLNTPQGQAQIDKVIEKLGGIDLLIGDNVMSLMPGDQKDEEAWARALPWVKDLTRRCVGQLWAHHTGHNTEHGYGTKTREWQLDTVLHFKKIERADTDVSFELAFHKARERTPATRADFRNVKVALSGDKWLSSAAAGGAALDFGPQMTPEQEEWIERARLLTGETFTRTALQDAWGDVSEKTVRNRADTLIACNAMKQVSAKGAKPVEYRWTENTTDEEGE